jgi:hypothetical protein
MEGKKAMKRVVEHESSGMIHHTGSGDLGSSAATAT